MEDSFEIQSDLVRQLHTCRWEKKRLEEELHNCMWEKDRLGKEVASLHSHVNQLEQAMHNLHAANSELAEKLGMIHREQDARDPVNVNLKRVRQLGSPFQMRGNFDDAFL